MTVRWRCRCSSTGCRAARTDLHHLPQAGEETSRRLQIEVRPYRHVIRRLFPGAHIAVDTDIDQAVAGLRRQQQMIDPQTVVLLPGAGLIIPECVLAWRVGDGAQRIRQPEAEQELKALAGSGAEER